ncbi:ABC transporter substrate-binding protein [Pseudomonas sp. C32]|jgi:branched-chain amino acid transport system substrate-binding protein|uniref:ABC transporter substrate-binding protein n=1 Tax=Pseudomonas sp. C32 TaxID=1529208 RepID=UPI002606F90B|nr:ABC transporter substrate-binding protein [Pseudomonas sp. C32]MDN4546969.1 ABC transporter substrate-binding protein [Pseudomonas sp. C32]
MSQSKLKLMCARILTSAVMGLSTLPAFAEGDKPDSVKIGITTFMSGSASVFGMPAKAAAELYIEELNAAGGIDGVKVDPIYVDEGVGGDRLLSEYRRVVQEQGAKVMIASISSGNCNTLAPVAEDLKVVNILWDCGTEKALEGHSYKYVFRTQANAVTEMVASVLYLLKVKPDFKTIAVVNQDYAWGRDSWEIFSAVLKQLKPDVKVVAELFPKFGASDFSAEVSRLQVLRPDVVLTTSWGGDLDTFIRQASQRGLLKSSQFFLALGETSLERLGNTLPDGVLIGARGDHYFLNPQYTKDARHQAFVAKYHERTGSYPIYSVYHMVQALDGMKAAYLKAIKANGGKWPNEEQLADAFRGLEFRGLTSTIHIRPEDGQGLESQLFGVTATSSDYKFKVLKDIVIVPADKVTTPAGEKSPDWVKTVTLGLLDQVQPVSAEK